MSRKKTAKRARRAPKASRSSAGKTARRTTRARTSVKRTTVKRAVKRAASKKRATTARSSSGRPAGNKVTTRRKVSKKTARPKLRLVTTPAARNGKTVRTSRRPAPKLKAVAGTGAAAAVRESEFEPASKQRVLFNLMRTRAQTLSVLHDLGARDAERPMAKGKWCVREIVLHLAIRDRARIQELETSLRGAPYTWTGFTLKDWKGQNAQDMEAVRHIKWTEALDLLRSTREELLEALESVPEEPAEVWGETHAFGAMLMGLPPHDLHHADQVRRWRDKQGL